MQRVYLLLLIGCSKEAGRLLHVPALKFLQGSRMCTARQCVRVHLNACTQVTANCAYPPHRRSFWFALVRLKNCALA